MSEISQCSNVWNFTVSSVSQKRVSHFCETLWTGKSKGFGWIGIGCVFELPSKHFFLLLTFQPLVLAFVIYRKLLADYVQFVWRNLAYQCNIVKLPSIIETFLTVYGFYTYCSIDCGRSLIEWFIKFQTSIWHRVNRRVILEERSSYCRAERSNWPCLIFTSLLIDNVLDICHWLFVLLITNTRFVPNILFVEKLLFLKSLCKSIIDFHFIFFQLPVNRVDRADPLRPALVGSQLLLPRLPSLRAALTLTGPKSKPNSLPSKNGYKSLLKERLFLFNFLTDSQIPESH